MKTFATFKGPGRSGAHYVFNCKEVTTGRYVKVMIKGAEYLTLAEVQVFSPGMSEHSLL
jgi:translation elongation factor P/translation initiation factor 5A